jgi:hypothetical protein
MIINKKKFDTHLTSYNIHKSTLILFLPLSLPHHGSTQNYPLSVFDQSHIINKNNLIINKNNHYTNGRKPVTVTTVPKPTPVSDSPEIINYRSWRNYLMREEEKKRGGRTDEEGGKTS